LDVLAVLADRLGTTREKAREVADTLVAAIESTMVETRRAELAGLGTFRIDENIARIGRDSPTEFA
jgi:nucleoid DNA-binding protein